MKSYYHIYDRVSFISLEFQIFDLVLLGKVNLFCRWFETGILNDNFCAVALLPHVIIVNYSERNPHLSKGISWIWTIKNWKCHLHQSNFQSCADNWACRYLHGLTKMLPVNKFHSSISTNIEKYVISMLCCLLQKCEILSVVIFSKKYTNIGFTFNKINLHSVLGHGHHINL